MKAPRILFTLALILITVSATETWGMRVPERLRHHGRLLNTDGSPASGTHTMTLSLWDEPVVGSKVKEVVRTVSVSAEGLYTVEMGGDGSLTVDDLVNPNDPDSVIELWLEIDVDGLGPLGPRIRLESVPFAVGAYRVAGDFFTEHNQITMMDDDSGEPLMKFKASKVFKEKLQYYEEPAGGGPAELSMEVFTIGGMATGRRQHMPIKFTGAVLPADVPGYEVITDTAGTHSMAAKNSATGHSSWMKWSTTDLGAEHELVDAEGLTSNRLRLGTTAGQGSELSLSTSGPGTEDAKIVIHTPEWTDLNTSDPGIQIIKVDAGGDSAITTALNAHLHIKTNGVAGENQMDFDVRGDTARMEMTSNPGGSGGGGRVVVEATSNAGAMSELRVTNVGIHGEDGVTVHSSNGRKTVRAHDFLIGGDTAGAWDLTIDTSGTSLRMNKADLVNTLVSKGSSASMSILDIGSSGQNGFVMQHNQTDLDFVMRNTNSSGSDSSFIAMHTDSALVDLHMHQETTSGQMDIHIKPNRIEMTDAQTSPSQIKVLLTPSATEMTKTVLSVPETVYEVDANGTPTGASLRIRYPSGTGGATEVFVGDLNGDAIPDLSVAGRVGIGTTSPTEALHVVGNACATGGHITCSDERFKEEIHTIDDPLARIELLRGVEFQWRQDEFAEYQFRSGRQVGFIAQEVQDVLPEIVSRGTDGYLAMDYSRVTPLLVEAIKEQQQRIEELETLVEKLAEQVTATQ